MAEWVDAGRVKIIPKGEWDPNVQYEVDDIVTYHHYAYIARKDNIGVHPIDDETSEYWEQFGSAAQIATLLTTGLVKPDGITITIDEDGTIHGAGGTADSITFDNEGTGLEAENVQDAIVEQNESITPYFPMTQVQYESMSDEQIKALIGTHSHAQIVITDKPYVADDVRSLAYIKEHGASGTLLSSDVPNADALYYGLALKKASNWNEAINNSISEIIIILKLLESGTNWRVPITIPKTAIGASNELYVGGATC